MTTTTVEYNRARTEAKLLSAKLERMEQSDEQQDEDEMTAITERLAVLHRLITAYQIERDERERKAREARA